HDLAGLPDRPFHEARLILFPAQPAGKGSVSLPAAGGTGNPAPETGGIPGGAGGTLSVRFGTARVICSAKAHGFVMLFWIALTQKVELGTAFYPQSEKFSGFCAYLFIPILKNLIFVCAY